MVKSYTALKQNYKTDGSSLKCIFFTIKNVQCVNPIMSVAIVGKVQIVIGEGESLSVAAMRRLTAVSTWRCG